MGRFLFPWISFFWMENLRHTQIAPLPLEINFHTISSTCCYETPLSTGDKDRKSEKIESFRVQSHCIKIGIWLSKYSTKNPSMAAVYSQERVSHTTSPFFFFCSFTIHPSPASQAFLGPLVFLFLRISTASGYLLPPFPFSPPTHSSAMNSTLSPLEYFSNIPD